MQCSVGKWESGYLKYCHFVTIRRFPRFDESNRWLKKCIHTFAKWRKLNFHGTSKFQWYIVAHILLGAIWWHFATHILFVMQFWWHGIIVVCASYENQFITTITIIWPVRRFSLDKRFYCDGKRNVSVYPTTYFDNVPCHKYVLNTCFRMVNVKNDYTHTIFCYGWLMINENGQYSAD